MKAPKLTSREVQYRKCCLEHPAKVLAACRAVCVRKLPSQATLCEESSAYIKQVLKPGLLIEKESLTLKSKYPCET